MPKKSPAQVEVVIILEQNLLSDLAGVVKRLRNDGLKNVQVMEDIGMITGMCAPAAVEELRAVAGATVELAGSVQIAPPESDIQ